MKMSNFIWRDIAHEETFSIKRGLRNLRNGGRRDERNFADAEKIQPNRTQPIQTACAPIERSLEAFRQEGFLFLKNPYPIRVTALPSGH
ncbi:MAG: hypothetical protein WA194_04675 [Patescibacteria group bacterium]